MNMSMPVILEDLIIDRVGTKTEFAEQIGMLNQNLNKMINPPIHTFARMCEVLELTGDEIMLVGKMITNKGSLNHTRLAIDICDKLKLEDEQVAELFNAYL